MVRATPTLLTILVAALALPGSAGAGRGEQKKSGKIEKTRKRMKASSKKAHSRSRSQRRNDDDSHSDDNNDDDDHHDDPLGQLIGMMLLYTFTAPLWVPGGALGDRPFPRPFTFTSYPYEQNAPGPHRIGATQRRTEWDVLTRIQASYERHGDGVEGRRIRATIRTNRRVNLDAELTRYDEDLGGQTDTLWHYKAIASYSIAISPRSHFSAGMGVRGMRFAAGDHSVGFVARYAVDLFPMRPLHLWSYGELGANASALAAEFAVNAGVLLGRSEAFIGYRHFRIVGVDFAGPQAGLAVWF